jgi:phosphopantothenoylcysteine decarboxylase/phosphopantothenate--cysteine ligase
MSRSNIAFVVTGSIAAYKACDVISQLVQSGYSIRTVATASALRFVGAATLEGLTGQRVLSDLFEQGAALEHIQLTRWADAVIVCPATANTLNRLSAGLADDLVGALFLAHDRAKPFLVAPAMNPSMWQHPATQESVEKLGRWGVRFVAPGEGRTACGETGEGRLAEPSEIVAAIEAALSRPARALRVLVTSGGTAEPVDGVRVLTNTSTGRTGALIAGHLARAGHDVFQLRARGSEEAHGCRGESFVTFAELDHALSRVLSSAPFDAIIHAAAVSDFSVEGASFGKLGSDSAPVLRLRPNPKLVDTLRARSAHPSVRIVAFKLTRSAVGGEAALDAGTLLARSGADLVVQNDLAERRSPDAFPSTLYFADARPTRRCETRAELAEALEAFLEDAPTTGAEAA